MSRLNGPDNCPAGWEDFWMATSFFGGVCYGKHWINIWPKGFGAAVQSEALVLTPEIIDDVVQIADNKAMSEFSALPLIRCMSSALVSGKIRSSYAAKGGGELIEMPLAWWRPDNHFLRFKAWGINPDEPFNIEADLTHWIYLNREDLTKTMDEIKAWLRALPIEPTFTSDGDMINFDGTGTGNYMAGGLPLRIVGHKDSLMAWPPSFPNFNGPRLVAGSAEPLTAGAQVLALPSASIKCDEQEPVFKGRFKDILIKMHKDITDSNKSESLYSVSIKYADEAAVFCKTDKLESIASMLRRSYSNDRV